MDGVSLVRIGNELEKESNIFRRLISVPDKDFDWVAVNTSLRTITAIERKYRLLIEEEIDGLSRTDC